MSSEDADNLTDERDDLDDVDDVDEYDDDYDEYDDDEDVDDEDDEDGQPAGTGVALTGDAPIDELATFVEFMVSNLVEEPDDFRVVPERLGTNVHIKVIVPEEEMGRVIGRQGRIARSMRTLLTIAASRKGLRASLDIDS
ncbi:MAG TPA: KH domain-containing protein [Thermomicrobiales bacterium]|nr:KH domain-containing protein [Thermomicrobiales bacterium]